MLADCGVPELKAIFGAEKFETHTKHTLRSIEQLAEACAKIKAPGFSLDEAEFLEEVRCVAAPIRAVVGLSLPPGYKLNAEAPFFLQWKFVDNSGAESVAKLERQNGVQARFPVKLPLGNFRGNSMIEIETVVYYCTDTASICYVDPIQARVTLTAADNGDPQVAVMIPVKQPSQP